MEKKFNPYGVQAGDIWVENHSYHLRRVEVLELIEGGHWGGYAMIKNLAKPDRLPTRAQLSRFNGKKQGYSLEKRAGEK
jgi:hypothetical protein